MKQPFWKKFSSYFIEFHIESAPSEINPHLYVSLRNGRYQLSTKNAVYSYGDLYDNYSKTFDKIDFKKAEIQDVLVLGLGLGSVPFMLEKLFNKEFYYTAVEIDENVIYLAEKYVLHELKSPIQTICTDALVFVSQTQERYDLIAMDIFLDDIVPDEFSEISFLESLKSCLKPNGILCFNRLALTEKDIQATQYFYENNFKKVFPEGIFLDVAGNWMLMNNGKILK